MSRLVSLPPKSGSRLIPMKLSVFTQPFGWEYVLSRNSSLEGRIMLTCADIMTPAPAFHDPATAIDEVARTMAECDIGPIPVVESADTMKLVGIVTDRDITVKSVAMPKM